MSGLSSVCLQRCCWLYRLLYQVKPEPGAGHQPRPPGVRGRGEGGGGGHGVGPHGRPLLGPGRGLLGTQALGWHGVTWCTVHFTVGYSYSTYYITSKNNRP